MNKPRRHAPQGVPEVTLEDFKERVRTAYPIDVAVRDHVTTRITNRGQNGLQCLCPFHSEKTPSFSVQSDYGTYKCFGNTCQRSGDVFSFLQEFHQIPFMDALKMAAHAGGVEIPSHFRPDSSSRPRRKLASPPPPDPMIPKPVPEGIKPPDLRIPPEDAPPLIAGSPIRAWKPQDEAVKFYRNPEMIHDYRDIHGDLQMSIMRIRFEGDDRKIFLPLSWRPVPAHVGDKIGAQPDETGALRGWSVTAVSTGHAKPIYGLERLIDTIESEQGLRGILIVEGEKTCDAANRMLAGTGWMALSPMNGINGIPGGYWDPLASVLSRGVDDPSHLPPVTVWPDAEPVTDRYGNGSTFDPQLFFSLQVADTLTHYLSDHGTPPPDGMFSRVVIPQDFAAANKGWDLADAEEHQWTQEDIMSAINDSEVVNTDAPDPEVSDTPTPFDQGQPGVAALTADTEIGSGASSDNVIDASDYDAFLSGVPDAAASEAASHPSSGGGMLAGTPSENVVALRDEGAASLDTAGDAEANDSDSGDDAADGRDGGGGGGHDDPPDRMSAIDDNPYFRIVGHRENIIQVHVFRHNEIMSLRVGTNMKPYLLHMAPKDWWEIHFGSIDNKGKVTIDWDAVTSDISTYSGTHTSYWSSDRFVRKGAAIDHGRVVFNSGNEMHVEGMGVVPPRQYRGSCIYVHSDHNPELLPDYESPYPENAPDLIKLRDIIDNIAWSREDHELSVLALFGWFPVAVLSGILPFRPHIWIHGSTSAGKSWIADMIVRRIMDGYAISGIGKTTEAGLRDTLNGKRVPVIIDEAESNERTGRSRMVEIIEMSRHAASSGLSDVIQGVQGGGASRQYSIRSSFCMFSTTPQLMEKADRSRFAILNLDHPHDTLTFREKLEFPAASLITDTFVRRLMGRIITQAPYFNATVDTMIQMIKGFGFAHRTSQVYCTLAAGAWLMLRDGAPQSQMDAYNFITQEFRILDHIDMRDRQLRETQAHHDVFRAILSYEETVESSNFGKERVSVEDMIQVMLGTAPDSVMIDKYTAFKLLSRLGIRVGTYRTSAAGDVGVSLPVSDDDTTPSHILVHRNSPALRKILSQTPHMDGYAEVMRQSGDVLKCDRVKFAAHGFDRCIAVPREKFLLEE